MILSPHLVFFLFITLFNVHHNDIVICIPTLNGRYTRDIQEYYLTVPHKLSSEGNFISYKTVSSFKHDFGSRKRKRSTDDSDVANYGIELNGRLLHTVLWPNQGFISPDIAVESREPLMKVQNRQINQLIGSKKLCHYTGYVRGMPLESRVALSTCNGLAGYVTIRNKRYFIEPLQDHEPNRSGQHLHIVYEKTPESENQHTSSRCGNLDNNWEDVWKQRFWEKYANGENLNITRRGTTSVHRYLETLVVCDKKFLEYHKNSDYELYVLTIMNMVSDFYHDYTSGHQMDVVVVRIIYLDKEEEEIDLTINPNADDTLASFCKWQQKINPKDLANPNHHDIAVLLTRYDICSDNLSNCGLMGLAYVASACTGDEPCAINEDGGLVLAIVVAHEMGHVMGCSHDKDGESTCAAQDADESYFVMAPYVHLYTTRWSNCSKAFITALFENDLGECLNDEPPDSIYKYKNMPPGAVYDAQQQCQMIFPDSSVCEVNKEKFCEMLLCRTSPTSCMSNEEPPADGTKCGENKWCFKKKCVEIGSRPDAVNGGWGDWQAYSECSRTCGGGVSSSERECNNPVPKHGGRFCLGDRKRIKICNLTPCPVGNPSFRQLQCKEHDSKLFNGNKYTWTAYLQKGVYQIIRNYIVIPDEPCVLFCVNEKNELAKLEPRVKDGTTCKAGTNNICISGSCQKVGCDGSLNSEAVEDMCGICNGDGTQCKITDLIYKDKGGHDYVKVAVLPSGAKNIFIEELKPSTNTLAIADQSEKKFYLNEDHSEHADGDIILGTVEGLYLHPELLRETLTIHGPLTEDLVFFVVFYSNENVGYHYRYSELSADAVLGPAAHYSWEQLDWNECPVKCDGSTQTARLSCVEEKSGKVSNHFCEDQEQPEQMIRKCNEQPCKTKWRMGKWGKCHACKFKSGVRMRSVECVKESPHPGTDDMLVEDADCAGAKPGCRELCNSHKKCKSRRYADSLPDDLMKNVWTQLSNNRIKARSFNRLKKELNSTINNCSATSNTTKAPKPKVGAIVKDVIPSQEIKIMEVPLKQSHLSVNLSDISFETMGDEVGDSIDTNKAKIATGENAAMILKMLQHKNNSKQKEKRKIF